MKKKFGMFGGSFNPPTNAHISLALEVAKRFELDKIIFIPVGNLYNKSELADEGHRYNMLKLVCDKHSELEVSDVELNQDKRLYAVDVFDVLKNKYISDEVYYIIGSDNLASLPTWKEAEYLIKTYNYIVLERGDLSAKDIIYGNPILLESKDNFRILNHVHKNSESSTIIREQLKSNRKDILHIIDNDIYKYIIENDLYQ